MISRVRFRNGRPDTRTRRSQADRPNPLDPLLKNLAALKEYFSHYVAVRADTARLRIRNVLGVLILASIGLVAGATGLVVAVVLLLDGTCNGLTVLLGGRLWAGQLLTGALVLAGAACGVLIGLKVWTRTASHQLRKKYELRGRTQCAAFERDVSQGGQ
jgi:hypothetical protein